MKKMAEPERNDDHQPNNMGKGQIISAKIHTGEVEIIERSDSEREPQQNEELPMKLLPRKIPQNWLSPVPGSHRQKRSDMRSGATCNPRKSFARPKELRADQQFYGELKGCEKAVLNSTECRERKGSDQEKEQRKGERRSDIWRNRTAEEPFA
ncbi:hypothetical protein K438DRAFT_1774931 [Mycena galopus ATCC 62051]|nr:hypothetical protein K438DRAFT_1774931 [Mycena galopus ATCC 62051]